ncbi:MAG: DNA replication complex GINS family protein [Candidatus Diapherotrites archaeon]|uniref:DNA replication complex GINS family protein n=1 Tax=Candidatus Iainarchaeum sp. TaxID=3101447 RepID=A0A8T4L6C5_9ARCH|nr:DNA replication complex GINS family protein [Candidatus Diapherotrites archaeon]
MNLSYDEIRRIYRLEKSTARLVDVDPDFYNSLNEFVLAEREKYLKSLKEFSLEEARDFANLKKMVEEIFLFRQKKILSLALVSSRNGSDMMDEHLGRQEQKLFGDVLELLNEHKSLLGTLFGEKSAASSSAKESAGLNTLSLKILKEVPAFIGTDMKEYGPFSSGETVKLPNKVAKLFLDRKMAELLDH